jgi:mannose/fructose/N-acetylgalactosamine-specific phosphotransferase system component IID
MQEENKMNEYTFRMKNDNGFYNITLFATDLRTAIKIVLDSENAPENAILNIKIKNVKNRRFKNDKNH